MQRSGRKKQVRLKNEKLEIFDHIIFKDALIEYRDTVSINKRGYEKNEEK